MRASTNCPTRAHQTTKVAEFFSDNSANSRVFFVSSTLPPQTPKKRIVWELNWCLIPQLPVQLSTFEVFKEICHLQHPDAVQKNTIITETFSGQTVPMINYATIFFCCEPHENFIFPLIVWINVLKTGIPFRKDFWQTQVSGLHFYLFGLRILNREKEPWSVIFNGSLHQNKPYPQLCQIVTMRIPITMCIEAKSIRCWNYSPQYLDTHFQPSYTFQPSRHAVATPYHSLIIYKYPMFPTRAQSPNTDWNWQKSPNSSS